MRCWAEIDLKALAFNLKRIRSLLPPACEVIGVVKADAYGHGLFHVAQHLARLKVRCLAVANFSEAEIAARAAPHADILLLSPLLPDEIPAALHNRRSIFTLSNHQEFAALDRVAARLKHRVRVHVKLDTGMGRLGGFPHEILPLLKSLRDSHWLVLTGFFSHFASADTDIDDAGRQLKEFHAFADTAAREGLPVPAFHFHNSAGILRVPASSAMRYVRPGLALYGVPVPLRVWRQKLGPRPLRPVLSWKTRVALIRDLPAGTPISYGSTVRTRTRTRVAVLAAGYADGIPRKLSNSGHVLIHGRRCAILGRVTMDMTIVDISRVPKTKWGDPAVLIGRSGKEGISAGEFAEWAETNPYEILCNISKRVPRIAV